MAQLMEVIWDENTKFYFEVDNLRSTGVRRNVSSVENVLQKSKDYLEKAFEQIGAFSGGIIQKMEQTEFAPDEIEVEFGIKFTADVGVVFSSAGSEAGITVKVKWSKSEER